MGFECLKWSYGEGRKMEEQAKEELQMLEAQYPNHFEHLKLELKSFIFLLQSEQQQDSHMDSENDNHRNNFLSFMIDTEESTSLKQRKSSSEPALEDRVVMERKIDEGSENESLKTDSIEHCPSRKSKRRDRVDVVLDRAEACLKKIRHFKTSLLSAS